MRTLLILLLAWLFGWLVTLGLGIWREVWYARLDRQFAKDYPPLSLRPWLYRSLAALITWPLYLILVVQELYVLYKLTS